MDQLVIGTQNREAVTRPQLARMMAGRDLLLARTHTPLPLGEVGMWLHNVSVRGVTGQMALHDVNLQVRAGEILGVAGVSGNGQRSHGTVTLLNSEDLDEVLAERISVLYEGRIMGIVERDTTSAEEIGLLMAGVHSSQSSPTHR